MNFAQRTISSACWAEKICAAMMPLAPASIERVTVA